MDPRVKHLHCIMPIANLSSVMSSGILSYERAAKLRHRSVAMQPVQDRRNAKSVPQGLRLHQYANLYFDPRNPMLYKRRAEAGTLCILAVSAKVLTTAGVVLTDCNAASNWPLFLPPEQWERIVFDDVFARSWQHPEDAARQHQHKLRKCAEVLVPHRVPPELLLGCYVVNADASAAVAGQAPALKTKIVPDMFFL